MADKKVIDKGMIEEFGSKIDSTNLRNAIYSLTDIVEDISMELSLSNQLIKVNNVDILPFNDYANIEILNSDINLYLAIKSAQIELNSIGPMNKKWKIYWNRLVNAWKNRRSNTRKAKKKAAKLAKKNAKMLTIEQLAEKKEQPYNLVSLKNDFFEKFIEKLNETSVIYNQPTRIRILAKEELGFKVNIYPVIRHDDGLKFWDILKNKFVLIKPVEAKYLLEEKNKEINQLIKNDKLNDAFYAIIRIFKNLYYSVNQSYNYEFIESLIYNCPNSLFEVKSKNATVYDVFIKVINYLNHTDISNFRSIYNNEKTIAEQDNVSIYSIRNFIKGINDYLI
jgi:hypothetical protein